MPPNTIPTKSRNEPTAAKIGAHDGPGIVHAGRGTRLDPLLAATRWVRSRQPPERDDQHDDDEREDRDGRSAINPPQSGITNWAVKSRM
jgi:hypothetical protein